ncbi:MAG: FAD-binding protein [Candidatus Lindowbacteria bacterium]|nr:FAD-binding protein [Candidatus Lindowbacteria bacterium]
MRIKHLKRTLRRIVGPQSFLDDPASLAVYAYDSSLQTARPDFVLLPETTQQVAEAVRLLHSEGIPYVARGAGTNLSGGSIPLSGGAVIALTRMKRILAIEPENFCARVEPGLTNLELQEALRKHGYFFAPDPASQRVSTIGGNVAENSGGPHCLKYGVTTNHILGLNIVAPNGEVVELGGKTLDSPGPDLLGLFVGSEGTLGIATEITCRILRLPEATRTMLAVYQSPEDASQTVSDIIAAGILPATLEMMDNLVIRAVEAALHAGYPTDAAAVLIIEIDGVLEGLDDVARDIEDICRRNHVREMRTARDEQERERLWAGRRGAFGAVARLFPNYSVSDGTVPRAKLPEVLRRVSEIGRKYDLEIGNVFHAGDGNLHPLVFFDSRDRNQVDRVHRAAREILEVCVGAGGTISGEHGVGAEKIHAMPLVFGPAAIELMHRIKDAIDPSNLCNPRKILPEIPPSPFCERGETTSVFREKREQSFLAGNSSAPPLSQGCPALQAAHPISPPFAKWGRGDLTDSHSGINRQLSGAPCIPTLRPAGSAELAAIVQPLKEKKKAFLVVGERTLVPYLPLQGAPNAFIEMTGMNSIIEHDAANLTVTAQGGVSLGELQKELLVAGQFLPLDAPANSTLGGIVASALPGPRRHVYGPVRDVVLGLSFVSADGRIIKAGGKTMKNVAGYDFGKLLIGAKTGRSTQRPASSNRSSIPLWSHS